MAGKRGKRNSISSAPSGPLPAQFRNKRKTKRTGQFRTAGETGAMGYGAYKGGTKPRFQEGKPTNIIVVTNPQNPQQGRVVAIGKKGGAYGRGGSNKTRWSDMDAIKKITGNIAPVALSVVAAGAGIQFLKASSFGKELAKRAPGGMNTVIFGAGAATAWIAYKYRSFLLFMAGLGIGAYALTKLGTREAKLTMTLGDEDGDGIIDSESIPADPDAGDSSSSTPSSSPGGSASSSTPSAPGNPPAFPNQAQANAVALNKEGNSLFNDGAFGAASDKYLAAKNTLDDPAFGFNFARAKHKLAEFQAESGNKIDARRNASTAKLQYDIFVNKVREGRTSFVVTTQELQRLGNQAQSFSQNISDFLKIDDAESASRNVRQNDTNPRNVEGGDYGNGMAGDENYDEGMDNAGYPISGMSGAIYTG